MMTEADKLATGVQGGFSVVAITFLQESVVAMTPWLIAMFAVIFCDLIVALRRCSLMGEEVRLSKAVRHTMGKMVTYFSFVLMVCMIEVAEGGAFHIDRWACLLVCAVEFASIMSNLLKPKGINIDALEILQMICNKFFGIDMKNEKKEGDSNEENNGVD